MSGKAAVRAAALAAAVALGACAPAPAPAGEPGADPSASGAASAVARLELTGTVTVAAGPAGRDLVTLRPDDTKPVALSGALADELREVDGARARVTGRWAEGAAPIPGGSLEVESYELLSIDGERPRVGILRVSGENVVLEHGDTAVRLVGAPPALRARAGAKVWIVGREESGGVAVLSYGFLRAP